MDASSPEASPPSAGGTAPAKRKTLKRVLNRIRGRTLASAEPGSFLMAKDKVLAMEHELERTLHMMRSNQQLVKHMYTELSRNNTSSEEEFIALFNSQANHCLKHVELCQLLVLDSITRKLALVQEIKRKCKDELDFAHLQLEDVKGKLASESTSSSQVKLAKYRDKLSRYQTEYDVLSNSIFAVLDQILEDAGPAGTALGFIREECTYFKILQTELFAALHESSARIVDFQAKMDEAGEHTEDIWEEFRLRCCSRCTPTGFKSLLVPQAIKLPLPSFKAASTSPIQAKTVFGGGGARQVDSSFPREPSPEMPKFQLRRPSGGLTTSASNVVGEPKAYAFSNKSREELKRPMVPTLPVDVVATSPVLEHEPKLEEEEMIMHQSEFDEMSFEEPVMMEEEQVIQPLQQQQEEVHLEADLLLMEEPLVELEEFEQMDELTVIEPVEEMALDTFHEAIDDAALFVQQHDEEFLRQQHDEELLGQQRHDEELVRQQQLAEQQRQQQLAEQQRQQEAQRLAEEQRTAEQQQLQQQQRLAQQQRIKQQQEEQRRLHQEKLRQQKQQEQELQLKLQRQQQKHEEQQQEQQRALEEQRRMEQEQQERLKQQQHQQQLQKQQLQLKQQQLQHQPSGPIPLPSSLDAVAAIKPTLLAPSPKQQKPLQSPMSRVVAVYDFTGEQPGDLPFTTGEELHIIKDAPDAGWYVAKSVKTGKQGLVPFEGFLKRLPALVAPPPAVPKIRPVDPPRFRAQYEFAKEQEGDLACKVGDIVTFVRNGPTADWFVAKHAATGQQGLVPREFFVEAPPAMLRKSSSSSSSSSLLRRNFVVVQAFTAQQQGDLTVKRGDVVEFVKSVSEDWVIVRSSSNGGKQGLVPLSFLKDDMDAV